MGLIDYHKIREKELKNLRGGYNLFNTTNIFLIVSFSYVIVRFLILSFKIINNSATINFFILTPTKVNKDNRKYLLIYSVYIIITSFFILISVLFFNSYLFFTIFLMMFFILMDKAKNYTV